MIRRPLATCGLALSLAACDTSFKAEGLDLPVDDLVAAFVETDSTTADTDEDGEPDLTLQGYGFVLTDREDLCGALASAELDALDDVFAVQVIALGVNDPATWETNASLFKVLLGPEAGDVFVAMRALHRVDGVTVADYATRNLAEPEAVVDSDFFVGSRTIVNGELRSMGGSFSGTLEVDLTEPNAFDVDWDTDGELDYADMDVDVRGRIAGADPCDNLGVLF